MLPEGWKECFLGELVDGTIKNGFSANPVEKISGMYILSLGCLTEDGLIVDQIKNIDKNMSLYEYILQPGDFLVSRSNTPDKVGRSAMFRGEIKNCIYPDLMMRFRVKKTVSANFIESVLKHFRARQYLKKSASGSSLSMVKITKATLEKLPVSLPPLPEQEKIAAILSTWDKAISTADALLENSRQQKKALMQQLLTGKRRLPGFKGEWRFLQAKKLFTNVSIKHKPDEQLLAVTQDNGVIPRNLLDRRVVMPEGDVSNYKFVKKGNFIISLRSFQGGLEYSDFNGLVSPAYTVIEKCCDLCDIFYKHHFKSTVFIGKLAIAVIGIRDGKQISYDDFACISLPVPPLDEQRAIAAVLDAADREIALLEQKAARLREEKKALMQQLLTGKRRVRV